MNKEEFLRQLELLLKDIPLEEREEALRFYAEYFSEAGPLEEQAVLDELGSPERVAVSIKAALQGFDNSESLGEVPPKGTIPLPIYATTKREDTQTKDAAQYGGQNSENAKYAQSSECHQCSSDLSQAAVKYNASQGDKKSMKILLILLVILASPILGSIAISLLAVLMTIPVVGAALLFAGVVTVIAVLVVTIANIGLLISSGLGTGALAVGLIFLGAASGLLIAGIGAGILFWMIPAIWRMFKKYIWNPICVRRNTV